MQSLAYVSCPPAFVNGLQPSFLAQLQVCWPAVIVYSGRRNRRVVSVVSPRVGLQRRQNRLQSQQDRLLTGWCACWLVCCARCAH